MTLPPRTLLACLFAIAVGACEGTVIEGNDEGTGTTADNATGSPGGGATRRDDDTPGAYDGTSVGGGSEDGANAIGDDGAGGDGSYGGGYADAGTVVSEPGDASVGTDSGMPTTPDPTPGPDDEAASIERGGATYAALCQGCHGSDGRDRRYVRASEDLDDLAALIDVTMPKGAPDACNDQCPIDVARFILATF